MGPDFDFSASPMMMPPGRRRRGPVDVLVLRDLADEFATVAAQAGNDAVDVVDSEHDPAYTQRVRRRAFRLSSDRRRRVELRQLNPAMAVRGPHHGVGGRRRPTVLSTQALDPRLASSSYRVRRRFRQPRGRRRRENVVHPLKRVSPRKIGSDVRFGHRGRTWARGTVRADDSLPVTTAAAAACACCSPAVGVDTRRAMASITYSIDFVGSASKPCASRASRARSPRHRGTLPAGGGAPGERSSGSQRATARRPASAGAGRCSVVPADLLGERETASAMAIWAYTAGSMLGPPIAWPRGWVAARIASIACCLWSCWSVIGSPDGVVVAAAGAETGCHDWTIWTLRGRRADGSAMRVTRASMGRAATAGVRSTAVLRVRSYWSPY